MILQKLARSLLAVWVVICISGFILSARAGGKCPPEYGHMCLGGNSGKRSAPLLSYRSYLLKAILSKLNSDMSDNDDQQPLQIPHEYHYFDLETEAPYDNGELNYRKRKNYF